MSEYYYDRREIQETCELQMKLIARILTADGVELEEIHEYVEAFFCGGQPDLLPSCSYLS
jgi:hypothetical protein